MRISPGRSYEAGKSTSFWERAQLREDFDAAPVVWREKLSHTGHIHTHCELRRDHRSPWGRCSMQRLVVWQVCIGRSDSPST